MLHKTPFHTHGVTKKTEGREEALAVEGKGAQRPFLTKRGTRFLWIFFPKEMKTYKYTVMYKTITRVLSFIYDSPHWRQPKSSQKEMGAL
jgi:hypothetical protein